MDDKLFVIAIGGTGMRCLESFVHLCAIGMFDNKEIDILTLDTDAQNGNKSRTEELVESYNCVKREKEVEGGPNANTFFSAKLNLYKFTTDYSKSDRNTYENLATLSDNEEDQDLAALFFDDNVRTFNLAHGYRAQTHLGSMLMYHGIMEAMSKVYKDRQSYPEYVDLMTFINKIAQAGENARVFVFGSIFGGTGASSIPIIPKALEDASQLDEQNKIDVNKVKFGSTLLTQYFSFTQGDQNERKDEKVIASAQMFPLNCQAAMQFYQGDPTVKQCYRRFYHVGWPVSGVDFSSKDNKTKTGGFTQKNDCHVVELMCACAAYDFFYAESQDLSTPSASYLYRCAEMDGSGFKFNGNSFLDGRSGDLFSRKLGMFLSLAHISLGRFNSYRGEDGMKRFVEFMKTSKQIKEYDNLDKEQLKTIDDYFRKFAYEYSTTEKRLVYGWIYQINNSVKPGKFIFRTDAFEENESRLSCIDPGKLFDDDAYNWKDSFSLGDKATKHIDELLDQFGKNANFPDEEAQHVHTLKEKFLAQMYNALNAVHKSVL